MPREKLPRGCYRRGRIVWITYAGPEEQVWESTGQADARTASRIRTARLREVAEGTWRPASARVASDPTLGQQGEVWLQRRRDRGYTNVRCEEQRFRDHVKPTTLGRMRMGSIRPRHVIEFVEELAGSGLAPRTQHHVYDVVRGICRDAVIHEVIAATPCVLPPGTLPAKKDGPGFVRSEHVFTREEIELLISDERVPWDRRVFYALEFIGGGMRVGEVCGRRWRNYDPTVRPLGRLVCDSQYEGLALKGPRGGGEPRVIPVHPTLAAILAEWRLSGWPMFFGRTPRGDDFIVPWRKVKGTRCRSYRRMWKYMQEDLDALGLRRRRQHDARRTFISLAQADGGRRDVLECVTHKGNGDVFGGYTTWPWDVLCTEVAKLRVSRRPTGTRARRGRAG